MERKNKEAERTKIKRENSKENYKNKVGKKKKRESKVRRKREKEIEGKQN